MKASCALYNPEDARIHAGMEGQIFSSGECRDCTVWQKVGWVVGLAMTLGLDRPRSFKFNGAVAVQQVTLVGVSKAESGQKQELKRELNEEVAIQTKPG